MESAQQNIENIYGLSPMQQGMLYHSMMDRNSGEYFLQQFVRVTGAMDIRMVQDSLTLLALRHDILRTAFVAPKSSGKPRQVLLRQRTPEINIRDLRHGPEDHLETQIEAIQTEEIRRGFDLERDSLLRVTLIRLKDEETIFIWNIHHIIVDGWSLTILIGDFIRYYTALRDGRDLETLRASAIRDNRAFPHYSDFLKWLESQNMDEGLAYWKELLDGYDNVATIPPRGRPEKSEAFVLGVSHHLDQGVSDRLQAEASARGITLNTVLETGWGLILQYYNFTDDVVFGKVVSGRDADLEGIHQMAGLFINTIPVRVRVEPGDTVSLLFARQQQQALESGGHAFCGLSDIQKQAPPGTKLIETLFALENYFVSEQTNTDIPGLNINIEGFREQVNYSIGMKAFLSDGIGMEILCNPRLYSQEDAETLMGRFRRLMESIAEDMDRPLDSIDLLNDQERELILGTFNDTDAPNPDHMTVPPIFESIALRQKEKAALCLQGNHMSYGRLNMQADRLANRLRRMGVRAEVLVAITAHHRDFPYYVGLLGILKSGGAFLPLDHNNPADRIAFILKDSGARALIVAGDCQLPDAGIPVLRLADMDLTEAGASPPGTAMDHTEAGENPPETAMDHTEAGENPPETEIDLTGSDTDHSAGDTDHLAREGEFQPPAIRPENLAYCIYTSGTTGQPKGVLLEHRGLVNQCYSMQDLGVRSDDTIVQFTNATFDVSVLEIFTAFLLGGTLVLVPEDVALNHDHFSRYAMEHQATVVMLPPPYFRQSRLTDLRIILTGGSAATPEIVAKAADAEIYYNGYGPTEITIASHFWKYEKGSEIPDPVPIGKAIRNTRHYILRGNALCGPGIPGELCLGGIGVARGYLNRPEATAEKFVSNPFGPGRIFRTGDMARWLPNGDVVYLGRLDTQVKVRGFRIELGEIESALRSLPQVLDAVVTAKPDAAGDNALYGYFTADRPLDAGQLRADLAEILPAHMIPMKMAQLHEIPMNRSHKPDLRALPDIGAPENALRKPPQNDTESQILAIFADALAIQNIGVNQDFFDLGGDSIKAIRIASRLTGLGMELTVKDIFSRRTVEELAILAEYRRGMQETSLRKDGARSEMGAADSASGDDRTDKDPDISARDDRADKDPDISARYDRTGDDRTDKGQDISARDDRTDSAQAGKERSDASMSADILRQAALYAEGIVKGGVLKEAALSPTQSLSIRMGVLSSWTQIELFMAWDAERFQKVWRRLLREFPLLLCGIQANESGQGKRLDYGRLPASAPFLDLSTVAETDRDEKLNAAIGHIRTALPEASLLNGDLAHRILCVKMDAWRFVVLLPISHLIFDGFSNEALSGRLNTLYGDLSAPPLIAPTYDDFRNLVVEGPQDISEDQLIQTLELERFSEVANDWLSWRRQIRMGVFHFEHPLPDYQLNGEQLLFMGAKLCAAILRFGSPPAEIPLLMVHSARVCQDQNFADQIGEFMDLLPAVLGAEDLAVSLHNEKIALTRAHNINICALLKDPDIQSRYPRAAGLLSAIRPENLRIPVINLLVLYGGIQTPSDVLLPARNISAEEQDAASPFLSVMITRKNILITGAPCPVGQEDELRAKLSAMLHLSADAS